MSDFDPLTLQMEFARALLQAVSDAERLLATLQTEFQYLKDNDLDNFEKLQQRKQKDIQTIQLFENLRKQFCHRTDIDPDNPSFQQHLTASSLDVWQQLLNILKQCDEAHRTSGIFMRQRLENISKALEILQLNHPTNAINLYNQLGNTFTASQGRSLSKAWWI